MVTEATICEGEGYVWSANGATYTVGGTYTVPGMGCDSDAVLNLTVTPQGDDMVTEATICEGEGYVWSANGATYTVGGTYTVPGLLIALCPHFTTFCTIRTNIYLVSSF